MSSWNTIPFSCHIWRRLQKLLYCKIKELLAQFQYIYDELKEENEIAIAEKYSCNARRYTAALISNYFNIFITMVIYFSLFILTKIIMYLIYMWIFHVKCISIYISCYMYVRHKTIFPFFFSLSFFIFFVLLCLVQYFKYALCLYLSLPNFGHG